jgi:hypothetical protein
METKSYIQIISFGWGDKSQAEQFARSAVNDVQICLLLLGFVYKKQLENSDIAIHPNGIKYDVIITLVVLNCLDWMDKYIRAKLTERHNFRPVSCQFINHAK